jgi:DNA-binding LytR/AlgR family response regulator
MLKAIAVDDEPIALEVIRKLSAKISFLQVTAFFTDAFAAIDFLQKEKTDLVFLDIRMPDISGIDLARSIPNPPMIIFTTAYSEHAVQSFEVDAIDYLLKPFSQARFFKACNKARAQYLLKNVTARIPVASGNIFVKSGSKQIRLSIDEILYVESNGNYMQFVLEGRKVLSRLTMSETEKLLPSGDFIRIHRSYIVSKRKVDKIDKSSVYIQQCELPVGAGYVGEIQKITG